MRSSRMSPSGDVITRLVNDAPAPVVVLATRLAPTIRSFALVVVAAPLLLELPEPVAAATTSTGLTGAMPLYSAIRTSASGTAAANAIVTVFAFVAAGAMFAAK